LPYFVPSSVEYVIVKSAEARSLSVYPLLNALAFTVASLVKVNGEEYKVELEVGVLPFIV